MRLRSQLVPALTGLLLALQLVAPWRGWMMGLMVLGGAWLLGYAWARSLGSGLCLAREMRFGWAQVGDRIEERFTVVNDGWAPALWVEVQDHSTMPDYGVSQVTGVGATSTQWWTTHGTCTRRGLFTLGPTSLRSGDPFGMYTVTVHDPATTSVLVTPPVVPLPPIEVAAGGRTGEGRPRPFALERTLNSAGTRAYQPGDNLRWIHWRVSAHRGELAVRLWDGAPVGDWWIVLDTHQGAHVGAGWDGTEEFAVLLAASLADRAAREKRSVGLVAQGQPPVWLPPRPGDGQRLAILRALALATLADQSLAAFVEGARSSLGRHASLVLVTPDVTGDWLPALLPLLKQGVIPTVLLLDPVTFGGAGEAAPLQAGLAELGIVCHLIPREMLDRPEARPGQRGQWEWVVTPSGRAILKETPGDLTWKPLA